MTSASDQPGAVRGQRFPRHFRLRGARRFRAVYDARVSRRFGPLVVYASPNDLDHPRFGLAVGRRVGNAVRRNRIKRRLREAFRHLRHDFPRGYDLVVNVSPHEPLPLTEYRHHLAQAMRTLHEAWVERGAERACTTKKAPETDPPPNGEA